jgi:hypothetical protein
MYNIKTMLAGLYMEMAITGKLSKPPLKWPITATA